MLATETSQVLKRTVAQTARTFRSIELFTGAGGLALGTHAAGFRHATLVEWDQTACDTLRCNVQMATIAGINDWQVLQGDVRYVDFTRFAPVDLVAGGPPCQPFSVGGKHGGVDDNRNMIPEFIRAVRSLAPKAFIMENVRGLLRPAFMPYYSYVLRELSSPTVTRRATESWQNHFIRLERHHHQGARSDPQYHVSYYLVNAADYGVPQLRHRVFVIGFRQDLNIAWNFPAPTHSQRALERSQWVTGDYWTRHELLPPPRPLNWTNDRVSLLSMDELPPLSDWRTVRDVIADLPEPLADREGKGLDNHRLQPGARSYAGHTGSPLDWPAKALKAGVHGVPGGENMVAYSHGEVRYFTTREAARLQTFPDTWIFQGAWTEAMRQLGNAVPMELAAIVARSVAAQLTTSHD